MLISGIVAAAPGISLLAGILLLLASFQMMRGQSKLSFPNWMATRELPKRPVDAVVRRAIPILACIESAIYPCLATPPEATKRFVGSAIFILTLRLLLTPFPLSNILRAVLIAFISLAYLERDSKVLRTPGPRLARSLVPAHHQTVFEPPFMTSIGPTTGVHARQ